MRARSYLGIAILSAMFGAGCAGQRDAAPAEKRVLTAARLVSSEDSANGYVPDLAAIGATAARGTVTVTAKTPIQVTGPLVQFNQGFSGKEILVDLGEYSQAQDFGVNGSLTLVAKTTNYPLNGDAYPVLTSFQVRNESGNVIKEYVNLSAGCASGGMWVCSGSSCSANPNCTVEAGTPQVPGSAFTGLYDWAQHQAPSYGFVSTNDFPRCNPAVSGAGCFSDMLPTGRYFAKYVLVSNSGGSVSGYSAGIEIKVFVKKDTELPNSESTPINGGLKLNLILVGDKNVDDSHTTAGKRNLFLLLKELNRLLKTESGANLALTDVKVYEWTDANGGAEYSTVDLDFLGDMFESGSKGLPAEASGEYVNVFLVGDIAYNSSLTVLGISGGILGTPVNGTQSSGVAFSTFNQLAGFNPLCTSTNCSRDNQESDFLEMASTIVHELGHFLGLNHPSERPDVVEEQDHDGLTDTPLCAARTSTSEVILDQRACYAVDTQSQVSPLSGQSCKTRCDSVTSPSVYLSGFFSTTPQSFCPAVLECQFNHIMWWTTKNRKKIGSSWAEDGNLFSPQSTAVLQRSVFLR
jgi:hypothetical protein